MASGLKQGYFEAPLPDVPRLATLSNHKAQRLLEDPSEFFATYNPEAKQKKKTAQMDWGLALHTCVLERDKWIANAIEERDFSGKGSVAARADWLADQGPEALIYPAQTIREVELAREMLLKNPFARALVERSVKERFGYAYYKPLDVWLHSRPDIHTTFDAGDGMRRWVTDLKSCHDITDDGIKSALWNGGYFRQIMLYVMADELIEQTELENSGFVIWVKNSFPFTCRVGPVNPLFQGMGRIDVLQAAAIFRELIERNPAVDKPEHWSLPELVDVDAEYWMLRKKPQYAPLIKLGEGI